MHWLTAIPVYNEARHVREVLAAVRRHSPDILVVNDGSTDGTAAILDAEPSGWPAIRRRRCTTSAWLFPPTATEGPCDEPWDFVGKKERHGEPDEPRGGDGWDHVALDPESRLVVRLVVGKRTAEATHQLVAEVRRRTGGRVMRRIPSDESPVYADAIRSAYGRVVTPPRTGRPGRPRTACVGVPPEVPSATAHQHRSNGRVVSVSTTLVFGTWRAVVVASLVSAVSRVVTVAFVERHHGTDRGRCRRKGRKSYQFSKSWAGHGAATRVRYVTDHFGGPVRTLRVKGEDGRWRSRTPAMAAGLTDHVWSVREWITVPAVQRR